MYVLYAYTSLGTDFHAADLVFVNEVPALEEVDLLLVFLISIGFHHTEGILDTVQFVL